MINAYYSKQLADILIELNIKRIKYKIKDNEILEKIFTRFSDVSNQLKIINLGFADNLERERLID